MSLTVIAIAVAGCLSCMTRSMKARVFLEKSKVALVLMENKIADLEQASILPSGRTKGRFGGTHPEYSWECEVKPTKEEALREVVLSVYWMSEGKKEQLTFRTLMPKRNLIQNV